MHVNLGDDCCDSVEGRRVTPGVHWFNTLALVKQFHQSVCIACLQCIIPGALNLHHRWHHLWIACRPRATVPAPLRPVNRPENVSQLQAQSESRLEQFEGFSLHLVLPRDKVPLVLVEPSPLGDDSPGHLELWFFAHGIVAEVNRLGLQGSSPSADISSSFAVPPSFPSPGRLAFALVSFPHQDSHQSHSWGRLKMGTSCWA